MGMKTREVGGGPATGLANDFVKFLQSGLQTGSFGAAGATSQFQGANPPGSTMGIGGILNDILSGGAGKIGGSLGELIAMQQENDVAALRSRFGAGGGTAFGTPAAYAESTYRAQAAPQIATAIGGLQENLIAQLLPLFTNLAQKGISQREVTQTPSTALSIAQIASPLVGHILNASSAFRRPGAGANMIPDVPLPTIPYQYQLPQVSMISPFAQNLRYIQ